MAGLSCGDGRYWPRSRSRASRMAPCLQGQYRQSAQVRVTWQLDAPDSRTMLTPGRSLSSLASLQPRRLSGDFDAALGVGGPPDYFPIPPEDKSSLTRLMHIRFSPQSLTRQSSEGSGTAALPGPSA